MLEANMPEPEYQGSAPPSYRTRYQVPFAIAVALVLALIAYIYFAL